MERTFDVIPKLQANFPFTKAYVAEQSGKDGGLGGARLFIASALLHNPDAEWIDAEPAIAWSDKELNPQATFLPVNAIRSRSHPEGGPKEVRDGLGVAEAIAPDMDLKLEIRSARALARSSGDPDFHLRD